MIHEINRAEIDKAFGPLFTIYLATGRTTISDKRYANYY